MLLSLLAFRRRAGLAMVALACLLPLSLPVQAAEGGWWQRDDQRQHRQLSEGVSAYRRGDFATAQRQFEGIDTAEGWYNLGNALARQGRYDDAIDAYDRALEHQPGMDDAVANRAAVDAARKRQQQSSQGQPPQPGSGKGKGAGNDPARQQPSPQGQTGGDPQAGKPGQQSPPSPPEAEDATAQQQADQAQREQMEQAMQQSRASTPSQAQANETAEQRERRQATEAWIRRVPDEPGSLLKAKFRIEHERRSREGR